MEIFIRLRKFRKEVGKTQQELAARLDISVTTWSSYETDRSGVPIDVMIRLASEYRLNLHWLLTGEGDMFGTGGGKEAIFSIGTALKRAQSDSSIRFLIEKALNTPFEHELDSCIASINKLLS